MDIAINKLYIENDIISQSVFLQNEKENLKIKYQQHNNLVFDDFDIENTNFIDFLDFLNFTEYDEYIFIINKRDDRFEEILHFLNLKAGTTKINYEIWEDIYEQINLDKRIHMGNYSLITGCYLGIDQENIIKHIVIKDNKHYQINDSILMYCSWNTICLNGDTEAHPLFLVVKEEDYVLPLYSRSSMSLSREQVEEIYQIFIYKGEINLSKIFIKDIGRYFMRTKINALIYDNNNIYADLNMNQWVAEYDNSLDFNDILNEYSLIDQKNYEYFVKFHHIFLSIQSKLKNKCVFITPISSNIEDNIKLEDKFPYWFAVRDGDSAYLWNAMYNIGYAIKNQDINKVELALKNNEKIMYINDINKVKEVLKIE